MSDLSMPVSCIKPLFQIVVRRISTEKRAYIYWTGHLPGGCRHGSYPEAAFEVGEMPNGTCFCHSFACHAAVTVVVEKR